MQTLKDPTPAYFLVKNRGNIASIKNELERRHKYIHPKNRLGIRLNNDKSLCLIKVSGGHQFWRNNASNFNRWTECIQVFDVENIDEIKVLMKTSDWVSEEE